MDMMTAIAATITLDDAIVFIWREADLLDYAEYAERLALWTADARYVVPIEPGCQDFENALNWAYDDHALRLKRVERLTSGQSVSGSPVARTIRTQSRFRMLETAPERCTLRCAQIITEYRRGRERTYTANVSFELKRDGAGLKIERKIVRLINSPDALNGIGYIL